MLQKNGYIVVNIFFSQNLNFNSSSAPWKYESFKKPLG